MSSGNMAYSPTVSASQETVCSSHSQSPCSFHRSVVFVNREHINSGFFAWLCTKIACRSGRHDDEIVHKLGNTSTPSSSICSMLCVKHLCCGSGNSASIAAVKTHRNHIEMRDYQTVCCANSTVDSRQTDPVCSSDMPVRCRSHCSKLDDSDRIRDITGAVDITEHESNSVAVEAMALRSYTATNTDSAARRKPTASNCMMLSDAAYGHATALDDVVMSDSEGWSWRSLSSSRPNSTEATGHGGMMAMAVEFSADDVHESFSDQEDEEDDAWQGVMTLPVLPVYDQVKDFGTSWSLAQELRRLAQYGWYWGPITRIEAEEKLAGQDDGTFLVRDSSDDHYLLSLSFRSYGRTLHTRIEHCQGAFSLYAQSGSDGYRSIVELVERSIDDSRTGVFCYSRARAIGSPSFPVRLTRPVSRFAQVRSLQYLCRFLIRQYTRVDHIRHLPLPTSIKDWLEERQY